MKMAKRSASLAIWLAFVVSLSTIPRADGNVIRDGRRLSVDFQEVPLRRVVELLKRDARSIIHLAEVGARDLRAHPRAGPSRRSLRTPRSMKILFVATKPPWPLIDGGRLLLWHTMAGLAGEGAEITLVAPADAGTILKPRPASCGCSAAPRSSRISARYA
jgi:hypothetical protein